MRALLLACLVASAAAWCGDCWCVASPPGIGVCPPAPLNYSAAFQLQLKKYQPENALSISCNPYNNSACTTTPPQFVTTAPQPVCGVRFAAPQCADGKYALQSFDSAADAERAGFFVTHTGVCGLCSTMQDLATYMGIFDMTSVGKKCGALAVLNEQLGLQCFQVRAANSLSYLASFSSHLAFLYAHRIDNSRYPEPRPHDTVRTHLDVGRAVRRAMWRHVSARFLCAQQCQSARVRLERVLGVRRDRRRPAVQGFCWTHAPSQQSGQRDYSSVRVTGQYHARRVSDSA